MEGRAWAMRGGLGPGGDSRGGAEMQGAGRRGAGTGLVTLRLRVAVPRSSPGRARQRRRRRRRGRRGGGGNAGRDAALPAGRRAVPGLRLLLAAVRLQPARSVLGGRSGRRSQAAGRGDGFLAGGQRTRPGERRGQVRAAVPGAGVWESARLPPPSTLFGFRPSV